MGRSVFWLLVESELKRMIVSPRFPAIFAISTVLIVLSVTLGVYQYNDALGRVETSERLMAQDIEATLESDKPKPKRGRPAGSKNKPAASTVTSGDPAPVMSVTAGS